MLVFAHIQKTAGQTMRAILRRHFGATRCDLYSSASLLRQTDWKWIRLCYPGLQCLSGHACMPFTFLGDLPNTRFFTFLRDPTQRAVSAYQYGLQRGRRLPPFAEWIGHKANFQTRMLAGEADVDRAIEVLETQIGFVGFTDRFNESLVLWKAWLQIPDFDCSYVPVNVAKDNRIKREILDDRRNRELLAEHNQLDERLLEHARKKIYAAQQERFGPTLSAEVQAFEASLNDAHNQSLSGTYGRWKRNLMFRPVWKLATARRQGSA